MSCGIYKIENLINKKVYIGQSVDIELRWKAHCYAGQNKKDTYPIHKAIYDYGVENFSFEIVEECPIMQLDEKEIFWIQKYNSYKNGYNKTPGGNKVYGENNPRAILTEQIVYEIRQLYNSKVPFKEAYQRYSNLISKRGFQKVWHFETWRYVCPEVYTEENRRWHATAAKANVNGNANLGYNNSERACTEEEITKMKEMRAEGMSYQKIAKILNRASSTVRKNCLQVKRKVQCGIELQNIETGLIFNSYIDASRWAKCNKGTFLPHKGDSSWPIGTVPTTQEPAHWIWL